MAAFIATRVANNGRQASSPGLALTRSGVTPASSHIINIFPEKKISDTVQAENSSDTFSKSLSYITVHSWRLSRRILVDEQAPQAPRGLTKKL